jgi:hypothetical protein
VRGCLRLRRRVVQVARELHFNFGCRSDRMCSTEVCGRCGRIVNVSQCAASDRVGHSPKSRIVTCSQCVLKIAQARVTSVINRFRK